MEEGGPIQKAAGDWWVRWVKEKYAMSGRPHGPYTVKKRRPVTDRLNSRWYVCAIASSVFFETAYRLAGESTRSLSLNGTLVFVPYTDDEEA